MIVHDPNNDLNLLEGVYCSRYGKAMHYTRRTFGRRWLVNGSHAYALAPGNGSASIVESVRT